MVPSLLAERQSLRAHHPLGASTGYMHEHRGDWPALVEQATEISTLVVELAALRESEFETLVAYLEADPPLPFRYLSVHAPSKERSLSDVGLVESIARLSARIDSVVVHPDTIADLEPYASLGRILTIENMDSRKAGGRDVAELERLFEQLPEAGFCFDVAHAWSVDPTMELAGALLDRFAERLRHVHVSSVSGDCEHRPLSAEQEALFLPVLSRCTDLPWILEAPLRRD
jgi:hypothetical protein